MPKKFPAPLHNQLPSNLHERKQEHVEVAHQKVIAKSPNGKWLSFDNLLRAKVILMPEYHANIYRDAMDLAERMPDSEAISLAKQFSIIPQIDMSKSLGKLEYAKLYDELYKRGSNPYAMMAKAIEMDRVGGAKVRLRKSSRKIKYMISFDKTNERHCESYARLTPQASAVLDILVAACDGRNEPIFDEAELKNIIADQQALLNTKQDPWRIFQYYRGNLIGAGFLRFAK